MERKALNIWQLNLPPQTTSPDSSPVALLKEVQSTNGSGASRVPFPSHSGGGKEMEAKARKERHRRSKLHHFYFHCLEWPPWVSFLQKERWNINKYLLTGTYLLTPKRSLVHGTFGHLQNLVLYSTSFILPPTPSCWMENKEEKSHISPYFIGTYTVNPGTADMLQTSIGLPRYSVWSEGPKITFYCSGTQIEGVTTPPPVFVKDLCSFKGAEEGRKQKRDRQDCTPTGKGGSYFNPSVTVVKLDTY